MRKKPLLLALFLLIPLTGCSKISALFPPDIPENTPVKEVRWLNQNWSADERFWFHHASQGTSTLPVPYAWFLALEQPELSFFGDPGLLSDPDYLSRFGFIPSPKGEDSYGDKTAWASYGYTDDNSKRTYGSPVTYNPDYFFGNPDGLPVGFTKVSGYTDPETGEDLKGQIGFTCAACHTGHMEYNGISVRIDGAPAITDLDKFRTVLGLAIAYTHYVPGRFGRFADRVLGEDHTPEKEATLQADLGKRLKKIRGVKAILDTKKDANVEEGFARLDALNRIGNQVFLVDLLEAEGFKAEVNVAPTNAPVNYPHIWDTAWFLWVQYDASIMQPMVRNAGEALGVSAKVNLINQKLPLYKSSVPVKELHTMEELLAGDDPHSDTPGFKGLRSPEWPADIFGAIDPERKQRGRALYDELCQSCHLAPVNEEAFWTDKRWQVYERWQLPTAPEYRYLNLTENKVDYIGTDPAQATILGERDIKMPAYLEADPTSICDGTGQGTSTETKFGYALAIVVEKVANAWYDENNTPPAERDKLNGYRKNCIQAKNIYKARPLDGIWATAPYLHNGSVPNLYDLLSPVEERNKRNETFCLGSRQFDPKNVGYSTECVKGTFKLNTTKKGNLNTGHENKDGSMGNGIIGRALSHEERLDLVEFLKSL